jgi:hypothetical protein
MAGAIPLASNPSQAFGLMSQANISGSAMPTDPLRTSPGEGTGVLGGATNPFAPSMLGTGQGAPPITSGSTSVPSFPANGPGGSSPTAPFDITQLLGLVGGGGTTGPNGYPSGTIGGANFANLGKGLSQSGYKSGVANALAQFLFSGAGYNPQVANALIAQLQPQVSRGEADIMEQFGSHGLANSSAAAIGLGDYLSQVNLNEGEILSQLYEQSVQNYLSVLTGAKQPQQQQGAGPLGILQSLLGAAGSVYQGSAPGL